MLLVSRQSLEKSLAGIEWPTLFFFIGLFVMVGALEERGAIAAVADGIGDLTAGNRTAELLGITWASAIGSGIVDNIPFTAAMIPVVEQLQEGSGGDDAYWWALSLGACFGGNATIIAAAANVAAAGMAARAGRPIGFVPFLKIGLPVTAVSLDPGHRLHRREVPVSPSTLTDPLLREVPILAASDPLERRRAACRRQRAASASRRRGRRRVLRHLRRARVHHRGVPRLPRRAQARRLRPALARERAREARDLPSRARARLDEHRARRRRPRLLRRPGRRDLPPPPRPAGPCGRGPPRARGHHPQRLDHTRTGRRRGRRRRPRRARRPSPWRRRSPSRRARRRAPRRRAGRRPAGGCGSR